MICACEVKHYCDCVSAPETWVHFQSGCIVRFLYIHSQQNWKVIIFYFFASHFPFTCCSCTLILGFLAGTNNIMGSIGYVCVCVCGVCVCVVCVCVCVCVCAIKHSEHTRDLGKFSKWARCAFFTCISCSVSGKSSLFLFFPSISLQHPGWVSGLASLAEHPPGNDATTGGWGLEQQGRAACKSVRLVAFLPVCLPACLSACMSVCLFACLSTYLPVLRCLSDNLFA